MKLMIATLTLAISLAPGLPAPTPPPGPKFALAPHPTISKLRWNPRSVVVAFDCPDEWWPDITHISITPPLDGDIRPVVEVELPNAVCRAKLPTDPKLPPGIGHQVVYRIVLDGTGYR